jgi:2-polyprenyl-3-methyl-5-hydroxy-6-metoxy-1,4-benzoquinol methylase
VAGERARWNHNIHYHRLILENLPVAADRALDVGCGDGTLARELRRQVPHVVGIDRHEPSIHLARDHDDIEYVVGDFLTHPFEPSSFDVVVAVASLHHMDMTAGLRRMRELVRPGGLVAVIGLARERQPLDLPRDVAGLVVHHSLKRTRTRQEWEHSSPIVWPPPLTYPQVRRLAADELPGVRYRRHLLWRYSLLWTQR